MDKQLKNVLVIVMKHYFCLIIFFVYSTIAFSSCKRDDDWEELVDDLTIIANDTIYKQDSLFDEKNKAGKDDSLTSSSYDTISIRIHKYMPQSSGSCSVQGAAIYGDFLFQFQDGNANVYIYNLKQKKFHSVVSMDLDQRNHCNNVSFSNLFYDSNDLFPLLYVSGSSQGSYNHVQVYRVNFFDDQFDFDKIQEIVLPNATATNHLYWTGAVIDVDNNDYVELTDKDELDRFTLPSFRHQQGAVIRNDKMYVMDGVPSWGDTVMLRIIDLKNRKDYAIIDLSKMGFNVEPEGIDFWGDCLLCATNFNKGIYSFTISFSGENDG